MKKCVSCFVCGNTELCTIGGEVHCYQCEPSIFDDEPQEMAMEATETVEMEVSLAAA